MSLRSLIRRHAAQLLTTTIWIEVKSVSYAKGTGKVTSGQPTRYQVVASDLGERETRNRTDSTAPSHQSYVYVPVPAGGLAFTPARGHVVIAEGMRWTITRVAPRRVQGVLMGYRLDLAQGGS